MSHDDGGGGGRTLPIYFLALALLGGVSVARFPAPAGGLPVGATVAAATDEALASGSAAPSPAAAVRPNGIVAILGPSCLQAPGAEETDAIGCVRDALADQGITLAQFVIATVPDYVDSNSAWTFDATLDALQRAAGAAGFVLYRFDLPDWHPESERTPLSGVRHEQEPGVILFQRAVAADGRLELLAVFLVPETPTLGLHEAPFVSAARFVEDWQAQPYELRVLGPIFSGSSSSLRRAVRRFLDGTSPDRRVRAVRLLSGSATSAENRPLLTFTWTSPRESSSGVAASTVPVTFAATVRTDEQMLCALQQHLVEINPAWTDGEGVVLLVESNTAYGQARLDARPPLGAGCGFGKALQLPFPMHISRLRDDAQRGRAAAADRATPGAAELGLRTVGPTRDVLPSVSPDLTAASVDTLLQQMLATIRREGRSAIGIISTDKRDHLFLAERIVREVPNALLFATEADLLYTHASYRAFIRGTVVASTYPAFNATQTLTSPGLAARGRQQFPTMAAQGTYNALLVVLGHGELALDYAPPGCGADGRPRLHAPSLCDGPPVWIEVVGQNGLWPVHVHPIEERDGERYLAPLSANALLPADQSVDPGIADTLTQVSPWVGALVALVGMGLLLHATAYLAAHGVWRRLTARWAPALRGSGGALAVREVGQALRYVAGLRLLQIDAVGTEENTHARGLRHEHRLFLLIGFMVLWFVAVWMGRLLRIWRTGGATAVGTAAGWLNAPNASLAVSVALLALLFVECVVAVRARRSAAPDGWVPGTVVTVAAFGMTLVAAWSLGEFMLADGWRAADSASLLFARTVNTGNWVSSAVPILAVSGVAYSWSVWNVRHLSTGGWTYRADSGILRLASGRDYRLAAHLADTLASPWRCQAWWTLSLPFGLLMAYRLYVPVWYTPDGRAFDGFLWWGSLLALFLVAHSLSQTVHLWVLVRRVLRHLFCLSMRDIFSAVAKQPLNWRLTLAPPPLTELTPMARQARALRLDLARLVGDGADEVRSHAVCPLHDRRALPSVPVADETVVTPVPGALEIATATALRVRQADAEPISRELRCDLPDALATETNAQPRKPYFDSETWHQLVRLSDTLLPVLRHGYWRRASRTGRAELDAWYRDAELLMGMQLAFVLRDLVSRLVAGMTVAIIGGVLTLVAHLFYSFPGRAAMLAFDWLVLAGAVGAAVVMLLVLEKDAVLSQLWSTTPGRLNWTGGFVYRLGVYGMVPVVTLFVWQFPELGSTLFSWIEPLQRAIP